MKYRGLDERRRLRVAPALSIGKRCMAILARAKTVRLKLDVITHEADICRKASGHREGLVQVGAAIDQRPEHVHEAVISGRMSRRPSVLSIDLR